MAVADVLQGGQAGGSGGVPELPNLRGVDLHLGLTVKYQLTTALARLRERGGREAVGEGFARSARR